MHPSPRRGFDHWEVSFASCRQDDWSDKASNSCICDVTPDTYADAGTNPLTLISHQCCVWTGHCELQWTNANYKSEISHPRTQGLASECLCLFPQTSMQVKISTFFFKLSLITSNQLLKSNIFKCLRGNSTRRMLYNLQHKCLKIAEVQIFNSTLPEDQLGDVSLIFTPCYVY